MHPSCIVHTELEQDAQHAEPGGAGHCHRVKAMLDLAERGKDVPFEMLAVPAKIIPAASPYSAISRRH